MDKKLDGDITYVMNEAEEVATEKMFRSVCDQLNETWAETLTDEQTQGLNNMVVAMTGGLQSPFLNERHMDALELTDEQKALFKKINEETKPERDKMFTPLEAEINKMVETGKISVDGVLNTMSKFRELGLTLKKRRLEVLTRSQLAKAREMARLPKSMTFSVFDVLPKWAPGPNSWKPGDPMPVEVKPIQPGKFPRIENQNP